MVPLRDARTLGDDPHGLVGELAVRGPFRNLDLGPRPRPAFFVRCAVARDSRLAPGRYIDISLRAAIETKRRSNGYDCESAANASFRIPRVMGAPRFRVSSLAVRHDAYIRRIGVLHADDMVTGVDVLDFAGDAARKIGQEIERAIAHFVDRDGAPER